MSCRKLPLEQPPVSDPKRLAEWLTRMMILINASLDCLDNCCVVGYGGLRLSSAVGITISTPYVAIPLDSPSVDIPDNIVQLSEENGIQFLQAGVWEITGSFSLTFEDENSGRQYNVELYNVDDNVQVISTTISVGRNMSGSNFSFTTLFDATSDGLKKTLQMRLGEASAQLESASVLSASMSAVLISQA